MTLERKPLTPEDALALLLDYTGRRVYNGDVVSMLGFDDGTELSPDEEDIAENARRLVLDRLEYA